MALLWLLAGGVLLSVAYYLALDPYDPFTAMNAAGIAGAVYIIALLLVTLRKPFGAVGKVVWWALTLASLWAIWFAWSGMETTSRWQKERLIEVRQDLSRGILLSELYSPSLSLLKTKQSMSPDSGIAAAFAVQFPGMKQGDTLKHATDEISVTLIVDSLLPDEVVLIGIEKYVEGTNPEFVNPGGKFGIRQARAVVRKEGIRYELQN